MQQAVSYVAGLYGHSAASGSLSSGRASVPEPMAGDSLHQDLRALVHDCMGKHLYDSAAFYADKLVTLSNEDPNEVFMLAQVRCAPVRRLHLALLLTQCAVLDHQAYTLQSVNCSLNRLACTFISENNRLPCLCVVGETSCSSVKLVCWYAGAQALYMGRQWRRALALLRSAGLVEAHVKGRYLAARCLVEARAPLTLISSTGFSQTVCGACWPRISEARALRVVCENSSNCVAKHDGTCRPCLQQMSSGAAALNTHAHGTSSGPRVRLAVPAAHAAPSARRPKLRAAGQGVGGVPRRAGQLGGRRCGRHGRPGSDMNALPDSHAAP